MVKKIILGGWSLTVFGSIASILALFGVEIPVFNYLYHHSLFGLWLISCVPIAVSYFLLINIIKDKYEKMVVAVQSFVLSTLVATTFLAIVKSFSFPKDYSSVLNQSLYLASAILFVLLFVLIYSAITQYLIKKAIVTSSLGAKVFKLDRGNPCIIVFTHREEVGNTCKKARELFGRNGNCSEGLKVCSNFGKSCNYENLSPAIPKDEEEMISWIDHYARSVGISPKKICSCEAFSDSDPNCLKEELFQGKTVIILGDAKNKCSFEFQKRYTKGQDIYFYIMQEKVQNLLDTSFLVEDKDPLYSKMDTDKIDFYGLVTITRNPIDPNCDLIILAGNRKLGQMAITKWLENINNQQEVINEYNKGRVFMQFIIKGKKIHENKIDNLTIYGNFQEVTFAKKS